MFHTFTHTAGPLLSDPRCDLVGSHTCRCFLDPALSSWVRQLFHAIETESCGEVRYACTVRPAWVQVLVAAEGILSSCLALTYRGG